MQWSDWPGAAITIADANPLLRAARCIVAASPDGFPRFFLNSSEASAFAMPVQTPVQEAMEATLAPCLARSCRNPTSIGQVRHVSRILLGFPSSVPGTIAARSNSGNRPCHVQWFWLSIDPEPCPVTMPNQTWLSTSTRWPAGLHRALWRALADRRRPGFPGLRLAGRRPLRDCPPDRSRPGGRSHPESCLGRGGGSGRDPLAPGRPAPAVRPRAGADGAGA